MARAGAVRHAISVARGEAEFELAGLRRRVEEARSRTAFLFDKEGEAESRKEATRAAALADAERFMMQGDNRVQHLERQIAYLQELARHVDDDFPAEPSQKDMGGD